MKYLAVIAVLLSGCATSSNLQRIVVLQNPESKQTVQCKVDPWGSVDFKKQIDNCIKVHVKAGYVVVADSAE